MPTSEEINDELMRNEISPETRKKREKQTDFFD